WQSGFFFQAEDGIRAFHVTGVQTCALPICYMKDAVTSVQQLDYDGKLIRTVELPGIGTASGFGGKDDAAEVYYSFTNYITPGTIYKFNPKTGVSEVYQKPKVKFDPRSEERRVGKEWRSGWRS